MNRRKRTYTHVFATHAILQERLVAAIVAQLGIAAENVLIIKVRNSFRPEGHPAFDTLNGGRFMRVDGWNIPKNRATNREVYTDFDRTVLQHLAPDFQVYSAMYTYWFVRLLGQRAAAYHVLEDGFGSYQSLGEFGKVFKEMSAFRWRRELGKLRTRLAADPRQMIPFPDPYDHLAGAGKYFVTSPYCFPFVEPDRRVVLGEVFPARYVGEYVGATVLATSSLVENGFIDLETYLGILRMVMRKMAERGFSRFYYKLHPVQARHPENGPVYRRLFAGEKACDTTEIGQEVSLESLAAGNKINFVTGVSTLAFHLAALGADVYTYHADIEAAAPGSTAYLATGGMTIFQDITQPL